MDRPTPDDKTEESFTFCFKILLFCIVFNLNAIYVSKSLVIEKFPMIRFKFDPHDSTVLNVSKVLLCYFVEKLILDYFLIFGFCHIKKKNLEHSI